MGKILTRMGDGIRVEMTDQEVRKDLETATLDAADRAKISPLTEDELKQLYEIFACPYSVVGVEPGRQVCTTYDGGTIKLKVANVPASRIESLQVFERTVGADTLELAHDDYSFKAAKQVTTLTEKYTMEHAALITIPALLYGAMPNLGLYSQPDGPCPNPADLLPKGKFAEARASYDQAIELATQDMVYVGSTMYEAGADGIHFDTTAAAGDAEFLAALQAAEILRKKHPDMAIQMGMAGEFILGMHGDVSYRGVRLAGLYPHDQVRLAKQAGVSMFGPAVNIVTNKSLPWNVAYSVTYTKACSEISEIPVYACLGMGVCGIPMADIVPIDAVSRTSKAHVEICRLDGL